MIDYKIIEILMDISNSIENIIDTVQTFIDLYLEQFNKGKLDSIV